MYHKVKSYMEEHHMINHGDVVLCRCVRRRRFHGNADMVKKVPGGDPFFPVRGTRKSWNPRGGGRPG